MIRLRPAGFEPAWWFTTAGLQSQCVCQFHHGRKLGRRRYRPTVDGRRPTELLVGRPPSHCAGAGRALSYSAILYLPFPNRTMPVDLSFDIRHSSTFTAVLKLCLRDNVKPSARSTSAISFGLVGLCIPARVRRTLTANVSVLVWGVRFFRPSDWSADNRTRRASICLLRAVRRSASPSRSATKLANRSCNARRNVPSAAIAHKAYRGPDPLSSPHRRIFSATYCTSCKAILQ